jgi:hypothetical protein
VTRRALALLVLALAACNKGTAGPAFRLAEPSSLAVFWSYTSRHATLHPYVAVANTGQDELVMFDPVDNAAVPAPIAIRPLSIPLPDARPALVASAQFSASDGTRHADLLVAVSASATSLQLIRTWDPVTDPDLATDAPVDLGSQVIALVATPAVDATGAIVPDRAWAVAALEGDRLAVVEYQLDTASGAITTVSATPAVQALGFEALSLAVDPSSASAGGLPQNPAFLYAASLDPIVGTSCGEAGTICGVAELDMRGAPGAWTIRAIDAKAPTKLVAAFTLQERATTYRGAYVQEDSPTVDSSATGGSFQVDPVHRVYAYLDPGSCGPSKAIPCGVAVLDPVAGDVLEDPWNPGATPKQYLPPMYVVSEPVALVPGSPPKLAPSSSTVQYEQYPSMLIVSGAGTRITTGVLAMPSANGQIYFADLARWQVPSNLYEVASAGVQTQISAYRPSASTLPLLALFRPNQADNPIRSDYSGTAPTEVTTKAAGYIQITPGFTPDDVWSVTYQGYLPDFVADHAAEVEDAGSGNLLVSLQAHSPGGTLTQIVNIFDPAYGVRVGDIVELRTTVAKGFTSCPDVTVNDDTGTLFAPIEGKILEIHRPDPSHLGGSLLLAQGECVPVQDGSRTPCDSVKHGGWNGVGSQYPLCWNSLTPGAGGYNALPVRIRAGGGTAAPPDSTVREGREFVVIGTSTGYAGRATSIHVPVAPEDLNAYPYPEYQLANEGERALVTACPLIPYPSLDAVAANPLAVPPDCDASCRLTCEQAAIARRARRRDIVAAYCAQADDTCNKDFSFKQFWYPASLDSPYAPMTPPPPLPSPPPTTPPPSLHPVIAFSLGVTTTALTDPLLLVRDTQIVFSTHAGYAPTSRYGAGANLGPGSGPNGAVYFDRTADTDYSWDKHGDGYRFYVPYVGNTVLDVSPSTYNSDTRVLR